MKLSNPPLVVTSDQPCFDTGTPTRGLSTGGTVGGTGPSLVQTTSEAAQRVHLPEVAVTSAEIWTCTSPVQATGRVTSQPVMRDTGTNSAQTAGCGQKSSKGYRLKQDYRLHKVAGDIQQGYCFRELPAPECCRFRSVTGS